MKIRCYFPVATAAALADLLGGQLLGDDRPLPEGLCTDARECDTQTAFLTLPGLHTHGHEHIAQALAQGSPLILSDRSFAGQGILIENPQEALFRLATAARARLSAKVYAITGSAGKSTTRAMLAALLARVGSVYQTQGNYNSTIGLPMTVLSTPPDSRFAVYELGMNHAGEIGVLSRLCRPACAIITNIGQAHIGHFGSREAIAAAKREILEGMAPNGALFTDGDEPLLSDMRAIRVSMQGRGDLNAEILQADGQGMQFSVSGILNGRFYLPLPGVAMLKDALLAMLASGLSEEHLQAGLLGFSSLPLHTKIFRTDSLLLLDDCYNAAPESMRLALDLLVQIAPAGSRRIAILGEMRELGEAAAALHSEIGLYARERADLLFSIGRYAPDLGGVAFADISEFVPQRWLGRGDTVLLKASHACGFSRLAENLRRVVLT